jgi:hypothetical protein
MRDKRGQLELVLWFKVNKVCALVCLRTSLKDERIFGLHTLKSES